MVRFTLEITEKVGKTIMGRSNTIKYNPDDCELVLKMRKGDLDAFEYLFRKYYSRLCVFAEDYVREPAIAEEVVADLFANLWEKKRSIIISGSLKSYLFRSVHNNCIKYLEHLKVERRYEDFARAEIERKQFLFSGENSYPIANLISRETESRIESAIGELPDRCREIFCLARFGNLSYEEISRKLGVSLNTVRTQMMRAMNKLRVSLKEYLPPSVNQKDDRSQRKTSM